MNESLKRLDELLKKATAIEEKIHEVKESVCKLSKDYERVEKQVNALSVRKGDKK